MSAIFFVSGGETTGVTIVGNSIQSAEYAVTCVGDVSDLTVVGNTIEGGLIAVAGGEVSGVVANNTVRKPDDGLVVDIAYDGELALAIRGNTLTDLGGTAILLRSNSSGGPLGVEIEANTIVGPGGAATTNTRDAIRVDQGQAFIHGNKITPRATTPFTRYGINIAGGDCNVVVGNALGDPADYGTDALEDNGADTQLTYPNDPTYGDNFTACPPGSP